jgi:hypothetical protein
MLTPVWCAGLTLSASVFTDSGNQSCPEASIPDLAVRIIRLFEELSLGSSESNLTLVFPF